MATNQVPEDASLDMDAMIDEIIARKGPYRYTEGLHEDRWEEVNERPEYCRKLSVTHSVIFGIEKISTLSVGDSGHMNTR